MFSLGSSATPRLKRHPPKRRRAEAEQFATAGRAATPTPWGLLLFPESRALQ